MAVLIVAVPPSIKCSSDELQRISEDLEYRMSGSEQLVVARDETNKAIGYWFVRNGSNPKQLATSLQEHDWTSKQAKKPFKLRVTQASLSPNQPALADLLPSAILKRAYKTPIDYIDVKSQCSAEETERILKQWKDKGFNYDHWFVPYFFKGDGKICTRFNHRQNKGCTRHNCSYEHACFLCNKDHGCFDSRCKYNTLFNDGLANLDALGYGERELERRLAADKSARKHSARAPASPRVGPSTPPATMAVSPRPASLSSPGSVASEPNDGSIPPQLWALQRAVVEAQNTYRAATQAVDNWRSSASVTLAQSRQKLEEDIRRLSAELRAKQAALAALDSSHTQTEAAQAQPLTNAKKALADVLRRRREASLDLALAAVEEGVHTPAGLHRLLSAFQARKITTAKLAEDGTTVQSLASVNASHLRLYAGIVAFGVIRRCHLLLQRIAQGQSLAPSVGHGWDCLQAARWAQLRATFTADFELLFLRYDVDGEVLFHLTMDDLCRTFNLNAIPTADLERFLAALNQARQQELAASNATTPLLSAVTPTLSATSPSTSAHLLSASAPPLLPQAFQDNHSGNSSQFTTTPPADATLGFGNLRLDPTASTSLESHNLYSPFNPASFPLPGSVQPASVTSNASIPSTQAAGGWPSSGFSQDTLGYGPSLGAPGMPLLTAAPPPGLGLETDALDSNEALDGSLALPSDLFGDGTGGRY
eukprot:m.218245 g.218245  ORF g.218245 m.218245 type:complete len:709 (+) comp17217_c0_seq3:117-2243(+)